MQGAVTSGKFLKMGVLTTALCVVDSSFEERECDGSLEVAQWSQPLWMSSDEVARAKANCRVRRRSMG